MGTETILNSPEGDTLVDERLSDGGHDRYSHYVDKVQLTRSAVTGKAVIALCGKRWVPTREGERYPVCPACKEIYAGLRS